jgi:hypothetical protein
MDTLIRFGYIGVLLGIALFCLAGYLFIRAWEKNQKERQRILLEDFTKCPDCASLIDKQAKVCLACGWREPAK